LHLFPKSLVKGGKREEGRGIIFDDFVIEINFFLYFDLIFWLGAKSELKQKLLVNIAIFTFVSSTLDSFSLLPTPNNKGTSLNKTKSLGVILRKELDQR
jgi:hypothetical protein